MSELGLPDSIMLTENWRLELALENSGDRDFVSTGTHSEAGVLMALWQRTDRSPVILYSDRDCQFTGDEYQRFLQGHQFLCSMSAV